ncbi:hypothetical protein C8A03DRAFT_33457 [Achaetomium macrosporum]|uniref:C2H2-type domain-containing protein n=1 Tax=Achaetomium macrosporum TaxID=79813 RepID=A0AAN7CBW0_9PEZI|nr:hypothetical protein C8A03DRAFT_33457 [Achaetomium macrosporum]
MFDSPANHARADETSEAAHNVPDHAENVAIAFHECRYPRCFARWFHDEELLVSHIEQCHQEELVCRVCGKKLSSKISLWQHKKKHTDKTGFKCFIPGCDAAYWRKDCLGTHLLTHKDLLVEAVKLYSEFNKSMRDKSANNGRQ